MRKVQKQMIRNLLLRSVVLLALLLLSACSSTDKNDSPLAPTSTFATRPPALAMRVYTGPYFLMRYPASWKSYVETDAAFFADPTGTSTLIISVRLDTNHLPSPDQMIVQGFAAFHHVQPVQVPLTVTFAGQSWSQRAIMYSDIYNGKSILFEMVALAANHPAQSADADRYFITYSAIASQFDVILKRYFTPMLQSFQFRL